MSTSGGMQVRFLHISLILWIEFLSRALAQDNINPNADPWVLNYKSQAGPDGPWNAVMQQVDFPEQNITVFPSLTRTSLFIQASACNTQDSACQLAQSGMWTQSGAHSLFDWVNSSTLQATAWDKTADPLKLEGSAVLTTDRIVLSSLERAVGYLDGLAITIASNFTVTYSKPDTLYTMDVGMLSLDTGLDTVNWTSSNNSQVSYDRFLKRAYQTGNIPSISYGLHIGSVYPPIPGSLILGGYDRSRCIRTPIVSNSNAFSLADISLESISGWPFIHAPSNIDSNHLLYGGKTGSDKSLTVVPNPGVPYIYLPGNTCETIASFLPVEMDQDLGFYLWNTTDPTFGKIMSPQSALKFSFRTGSELDNISVPFALLNLTLDYPLTNSPKQYFPCSSYTPADGMTYHLGRAFLQAAFLGQHGQTKKTFLAQAPGPAVKAEIITKLASTDDMMTAMPNAPSWNETWTAYLKADNNTSDAADGSSSRGLGGGAIAGIAIGAAAGVVLLAGLVLMVIRRRRKSNIAHTVHWGGRQNAVNDKDEYAGEEPRSESASEPVHEAGANGVEASNKNSHAEMEAPAYIGELEGSYAYRRSQGLPRY